jgi:hypothetical protein
MKTKITIIVSLILTITAVQSSIAKDVPDQTIASWTALTPDIFGDGMDTNKYKVSISGGNLVIADTSFDKVTTYSVPVSKLKRIEEWPSDDKRQLGLDVYVNEEFMENPPSDTPASSYWLYFSISDTTTHDLVKNKLNDLMGK